MKSMPLKLSKIESKVCEIISARGSVLIGDIAKEVFKGVPQDMRPLQPNNSITSAIRQINRKLEGCGEKYRIEGMNHGSKGKLVYWEGAE